MNRQGLLLPALILAAIWLLLSGGAASSWVIGAPAIALASWAASRLRVMGSADISPRGFALFVPFFVWESVRGGVDVARRVLSPSPKLVPGFHQYTMTLMDPHAQLLFVNSVSLLPGTLAADLSGTRVRVHTLDMAADTTAELARLERRVADVYRGAA